MICAICNNDLEKVKGQERRKGMNIVLNMIEEWMSVADDLEELQIMMKGAKASLNLLIEDGK